MMTKIIDHQRHRLTEIRALRGLSQAALAERLDATSQWVSQLETGRRQLTESIIRKMAEALSVEPADILAPPGAALSDGSLREPEASIYDADDAPQMLAEFSRLHPGINHGELFQVRSPAMNLAGILADDLVFVDLSDVTPEDGKVCLAQRYAENGEAETIVRQVEGPFLVSRTTDERFIRPLLLDGANTTIMGRVISSHRIYK